MGFNIATLTNYTQKSTELLRAGILFNDNYSEFDSMNGIDYKKYLNFIDNTVIIQDGFLCDAVASGGTEVTEREIEVFPMHTKQKYCFEDLYQKAVNVKDVAASLTLDYMSKMAQETEKYLWQGKATGLDGWLTQLHADANLGSLGETDVLTVSNIDDKLILMVNGIPDGLTTRGLLTIYVSYSVFNLYKQNRLAANLYRDQTTNFPVNEMWLFGYEGQIKIKAVAGLVGVNDDMILTWSKNLVIGRNEVTKIAKGEWVLDNINDVAYLKTEFQLGTSYKYAQEVVTYK